METIPNEVRRWNWGAFFLTWIWGIGNNVLIAFLCFVPFLNLIWPIVLGVKGGEWAWQNKRWDNVEHFQRVQRIWAWVGFGFFLWFIAMFAGMIYFIVTHIPETKMYFENVQIIRTASAQSTFTGEVTGTLPSAAIDIPSTPGVSSIPAPAVGPMPTPSTTLQPMKPTFFRLWDAWHDPLLDDNPERTGATPWFRSFLPKRATKNVE